MERTYKICIWPWSVILQSLWFRAGEFLCRSVFLKVSFFLVLFCLAFFKSPCTVFWLFPGVFPFQIYENIYNFKRQSNNASLLLGVSAIYFYMLRGLRWLLFKFSLCNRGWKVWPLCPFPSQSLQHPPLHFHHIPGMPSLIILISLNWFCHKHWKTYSR